MTDDEKIKAQVQVYSDTAFGRNEILVSGSEKLLALYAKYLEENAATDHIHITFPSLRANRSELLDRVEEIRKRLDAGIIHQHTDWETHFESEKNREEFLNNLRGMS